MEGILFFIPSFFFLSSSYHPENELYWAARWDVKRAVFGRPNGTERRGSRELVEATGRRTYGAWGG